jgi:hypothetical protein
VLILVAGVVGSVVATRRTSYAAIRLAMAAVVDDRRGDQLHVLQSDSRNMSWSSAKHLLLLLLQPEFTFKRYCTSH